MTKNLFVFFLLPTICIGCSSPKFIRSKDVQFAKDTHYLYQNIGKINDVTGKVDIGLCSTVGKSINFNGIKYSVEKYINTKNNNWATHKVGKKNTNLLLQLDNSNRLIAYAFSWNVGKEYIASTPRRAVYIDESLPVLRTCKGSVHE